MQTIYALDLGTTKFCIAKYDHQDKMNPIMMTSCPSAGMRRGMLSDFNKVSERLSELVEQAEKKFQADIRHVAVGVAGCHLKGGIVTSSHKIAEPKITQKTLDQLKIKADKNCQIPGRELLHLLPIDYMVDDRTTTTNPLSLSGQKIDSRYFYVDSDQLYLRDILGAVNEAGLEVLNLYAEPFASSCVTVPQKAKDLGIAICDIGGGTTDGIVFTDGSPTSCFTFNIGGLMMTKDIAIGLNLPFEEAEKAKSYFGLSGQKNPHEILVTAASGGKKTITGKEVQRILGHRIFEWADALREKLHPYKGRLGSGIYLTGGGSLVLSLSQILEKQFHVPVTTTFPSFGELKNNTQFAAKYATVIGLLQLETHKRLEAESIYTNPWKFPFLRQVKSWIKEFS